MKDTDYKFALNIGLKFVCPEELFMDSKHSKNMKFQLPTFDPYLDMLKQFKDSEPFEKILEDV